MMLTHNDFCQVFTSSVSESVFHLQKCKKKKKTLTLTYFLSLIPVMWSVSFYLKKTQSDRKKLKSPERVFNLILSKHQCGLKRKLDPLFFSFLYMKFFLYFKPKTALKLEPHATSFDIFHQNNRSTEGTVRFWSVEKYLMFMYSA